MAESFEQVLIKSRVFTDWRRLVYSVFIEEKNIRVEVSTIPWCKLGPFSMKIRTFRETVFTAISMASNINGSLHVAVYTLSYRVRFYDVPAYGLRPPLASPPPNITSE